MKKYFVIMCVVCLIFAFSACGNSTADVSNKDLYEGEYISTEIEGEMKIYEDKGEYRVYITFEDLVSMGLVGYVEDGTLYYTGKDEYGNKITGNIEEYGEDYPVRVEMYKDGSFIEIEFERKKK